jgi:ATP-dependent RNA helicase MSS116, mitochondrial
MGFKRDVESIISHLPKKEQRQTLLFSATVPADVKAVIRDTMRNDFVTVDCIHDTDPGSHTNAQVSQTHVIVDADDRLVSGTVDVLRKLIADTKAANEPLKLVVFFNTAHLVSYYATLFLAMPSITLKLPVYELHSRKSQSYRTRTALSFRNDKEAILFTSDVSARGVDYPGVTDVVQVAYKRLFLFDMRRSEECCSSFSYHTFSFL